VRWSYLFLTCSRYSRGAPLYMLITSLKAAPRFRATNPWWVFHPTLSNYVELLSSNQSEVLLESRWYRSSWLPSPWISVPAAFALARMRSGDRPTLADRVFLTYLIPDTLLFLPLFKMSRRSANGTGNQLITLVCAADRISDAHGAFDPGS